MKVLALVFALFVGGCAAAQKPPSILDELTIINAQPSPNERVRLSDLGIVKFASKTLGYYGVRSLDSAILSTGGTITLATLSTAAVATATTAGGSVLASLSGAANWLLQVLGIVKPDQRDAAFAEGSEDILRAISEYEIALARAKIYEIPTDRVTTQGAGLLKKVTAAIIAVNRQMVGLRPRFRDAETLQQPISP